MANSQVGSQVALGSFSWEIWGIVYAFIKKCKQTKTNEQKICLLILLSWKNDPNLTWHQLLIFCNQDHCLFHFSKTFQTVAAWYGQDPFQVYSHWFRFVANTAWSWIQSDSCYCCWEHHHWEVIQGNTDMQISERGRRAKTLFLFFSSEQPGI